MTAAIACGAGLLVATGGTFAQDAPPPPDVPSRVLIQSQCAGCHTVDQVFAAKKTSKDWATTLDSMIGYGAEVSAADREIILAYLAKHNGQ